MNFFKKKKSQLLTVAVMLLLAFALIGCSGDDVVNSVTNPNPNTLTPTGTVIGVVRDSVTNQPIAGAVVDIDGHTATTNENGQYSLKNIPATTDAADHSVHGSYTMTVNLKGVTSPVNMKSSTATPRYPEFTYKRVDVKFTTLNDAGTPEGGDVDASGGSGSRGGEGGDGGTAIGGNGGTNSSNHATPVTGLGASANVYVGKLAAAISGLVVYGQDIPNLGNTHEGANCAVSLMSAGSNNSGTGSAGNLFANTTTAANGTFSFSNVESQQYFTIIVTCPDGYSTARDYPNGFPVTSLADGLTASVTVPVEPGVAADTQDPWIFSVSPETGTDVGLPAGGEDVVFRFNEPITQNAYSTTLANDSVFGGMFSSGLFFNVHANFLGAKAGNIATIMKWTGPGAVTCETDSVTHSTLGSSTCSELHVLIPVLGASSRYSVMLDNTALTTLTDLSGRHIDIQKSVDRTDLVYGLYTTVTVFFTTSGSPISIVSLPIVSLTNSPICGLDNVPGAGPSLDWAPIVGAKGYNVYRRANEVWGTTIVAGPYERLNSGSVISTTTSDFSDVFQPFTENGQIMLTYDYCVLPVNADGIEVGICGTGSNVVLGVHDNCGPQLKAKALADPFLIPTCGEVNGGFTWDCTANRYIVTDFANGDSSLTLHFNECLDEVSAELPANYVITVGTGTAPTVSSAVYTFVASPVSGPDYCTSSVVTLTLSAALPQNTLGRVILTGDGTTAGDDGICQTTADTRDTQVIPVGQGLPEVTCITGSGTGGIIDAGTVIAGDDEKVPAGCTIGTTCTSVNTGDNGICETAKVGTDVQTIPVGQGQKSQVCTRGLYTNAVANDVVSESDVVTVSNVTDVAGNVIQATKDEEMTDGSVK